jgi:hypothetical protein
MKKSLSKVVGEDTPKRGPGRYARLLLNDDRIVMDRGASAHSTPSTIIADLVRKGLAYEALEMGADDPVIRNLLRTIDQMVQHRVTPLSDALEASQLALQQTQLAVQQTQIFIASLFLTLTAKFEFPLENCSEQERANMHEQLTVHANDMLTIVTTPTTNPKHDDKTAPHSSTAARRLTNQQA